MALLKQSTAYSRAFYLVSSTDHLTGKTGASPTVNISKAAAAFAAAAGTVTEISAGWYKIALTTVDTGTLGDLAYDITASGADATDFADQVVAFDPTDSVRLGLTALPNAAAAAANGIVTVSQVRVQKNAALANFVFYLTSSVDHVSPAVGITVTATRSLDGAAFAACANSVTEIANGFYKISFAATDLNATVVALSFTGVGADGRALTLITQT